MLTTGDGAWHTDNYHPVLSSMETVPMVSEHHRNEVLFPYVSYPARLDEESSLGIWWGPVCSQLTIM